MRALKIVGLVSFMLLVAYLIYSPTDPFAHQLRHALFFQIHPLANLPVIAFFGWWDPVQPGQLVWGWIVVAFAGLPLLALLLAAVQLIAGGSRGHLAGALLTLLVGALLLPYLIGHGWTLDLGYAYQSPPTVQNANRC